MRIITLFVFAVALIFVGCREHAEHPEHPDDEQGEARSDDEAAVSNEVLAQVIEKFVAAAAQEDAYVFVDPQSKKTLTLSLDKVHKERLSKTGPGTYFACADFTADGEKVFDLDFWVKGTVGNLKVVEVTLHKEDGEARYNWKEADGVWTRHVDGKPLDAEAAADDHADDHEHPEPAADNKEQPEHPEHPTE
jgi:hypothetical protein